MSTKAYPAWRCSTEDFNDVLRSLRKFAIRSAVNTLREEIAGFSRSWIDKDLSKFAKFYHLRPSPKLRNEFEVRIALALAREASETNERGRPCDIDASLNVWMLHDQMYLKGYGECWNTTRQFTPKRAEDYSYDSRVDKPKSVTGTEWNERAKFWDETCDDWDGTRLVHEIISAKQRIGLDVIAKLMIPKLDNVFKVLPLQW